VIEVRPLTATIGAEVTGVDLRAGLSDAERDRVRDALLRHLVLFFRDQDLTEDEQLAFASRFGRPVSASVDPTATDPLLFVTLEDTADNPPKADRWHTDVPFVAEPPDIAVLSMRDAPEVGGDTLWASLYAAYERLSPPMQELVCGLELDLDLGTSRELVRRMYDEDHFTRVVEPAAVARHPLVRTHPETGRPALYLCGEFMRGIAGLHAEESLTLLGYLRSLLDDPNLHCRWRWRQHDVAMWDERCTTTGRCPITIRSTAGSDAASWVRAFLSDRYCPDPMPAPTSTRDKLLDAAARLFAERGIDNVSLAEIVRTAGQRNASAVQYHFGTRDEVMRGVLGRHVPAIAERRNELLQRARSRPDDDVRSAAEAIVRPITEFAQRGWRERAYLQIGSELTGALDRTTPEIRDLMTQTAGFEAWDLMRTRCGKVPADLWQERQDICIVFIGRAAADRARLLDRAGDHPILSDDRFVDNLIAMVVGAMTAPNPGD
jgi:taurine dioxygenase